MVNNKDVINETLNRKKAMEKYDLSEAEDAGNRFKREQIENYWKKVGIMKADGNAEGDKILKEFLEDKKKGIFFNSIDFAAFKLGIGYESDLPDIMEDRQFRKSLLDNALKEHRNNLDIKNSFD